MSCKHQVIYEGLCALCGASVRMDSLQNEDEMFRVTPSARGVLMSRTETQKFAHQTQQRLISSRKLALILDLDNTLIHSTIDANCARHVMSQESQHESENQIIQLSGLGQNFFVKIRPGIKKFFESLQQQFEFYMFTAGTRKYADQIADIIDPGKLLFGDRIYVREDRNEQDMKSLQQIFPLMKAEEMLAVIVDDRLDAWVSREAPIVLLEPYIYFAGAMDLPRLAFDYWTYPIPLTLPLWKQLGINMEKRDKDSQFALPQDKLCLHRVINDAVIEEVGVVLQRIYSKFYQMYDQSQQQSKVHDRSIKDNKDDIILTSKEKEPEIQSHHQRILSPDSSQETSVLQTALSIRSNVLRGSVLCFTGCIPAQCRPTSNHPLWQMARSLGAECRDDVRRQNDFGESNANEQNKSQGDLNAGREWRGITHLICVNEGTEKFIQALALNKELNELMKNEKLFSLRPCLLAKPWGIDRNSAINSDELNEQVNIANDDNEIIDLQIPTKPVKRQRHIHTFNHELDDKKPQLSLDRQNIEQRNQELRDNQSNVFKDQSMREIREYSRPYIHIIHVLWLVRCSQQWAWVDETPFELNFSHKTKSQPPIILEQQSKEIIDQELLAELDQLDFNNFSSNSNLDIEFQNEEKSNKEDEENSGRKRRRIDE